MLFRYSDSLIHARIAIHKRIDTKAILADRQTASKDTGQAHPI